MTKSKFGKTGFIQLTGYRPSSRKGKTRTEAQSIQQQCLGLDPRFTLNYISFSTVQAYVPWDGSISQNRPSLWKHWSGSQQGRSFQLHFWIIPVCCIIKECGVFNNHVVLVGNQYQWQHFAFGSSQGAHCSGFLLEMVQLLGPVLSLLQNASLHTVFIYFILFISSIQNSNFPYVFSTYPQFDVLGSFIST